MEAIKLSWIGSQHAGHSLAIVNNNICTHLKQDHQLDLRVKLPDSELAYVRKVETEQERRMYFPHSPSDVSIVHNWPPDWTKPKCKIWIGMQAWEYGAIPKAWFIPMRYGADEIWVYSSYNKESYIRSGVPADKIRTIPLGVNETVFYSEEESHALSRSCFRFLFVGGTISRKGIDVLLQAYMDEFTAADDVCLVIKDAGNDSFYKGLTLKE